LSGYLQSVAVSVNDDLRLRLTASERRDLAEIGAKRGKKALEESATIAKPATMLAWNRQFADQVDGAL
jgi:hypothetical protein